MEIDAVNTGEAPSTAELWPATISYRQRARGVRDTTRHAAGKHGTTGGVWASSSRPAREALAGQSRERWRYGGLDTASADSRPTIRDLRPVETPMAKRKATALSSSDRLGLAKQRTNELVDHMIALIAMHESNQVVLKTDALSRQIPRSHAAHAFNNFRFSMAGFEIVRLCAFWEPPDPQDVSIPNVLNLFDDPQVRVDIRRHVTSGESRSYLSEEAYASILEEMAQEIDIRIDQTLARARAVESSSRLKSVRNHRHKFLAHNLIKTRAEEAGPVAPMKNDDVDWLFSETEAIVDGLHHGLNRTGFDWSGSHEISKRQAESLWHGTKFEGLK